MREPISCSSFVEWTPSVLGSLLSACTKRRSLNIGRSIHANILKGEGWCCRDLYVQNHLLNFYAKCKKMDLARQVFNHMPRRNTVSWTALISGYDQCGKCKKALELFSLMVSQDLASPPNQFTYASALSACTKQECLPQGMQLHSHALRRGFLTHVLVPNVLISSYMACSRVAEAELVFSEIFEPDQVSWNSLISGLAQNGFSQTALKRFQRMILSEVRITCFALSAAITACLEDELDGKRHHGLAVKTGLDLNCFTGCAMVTMYSRFKNMDDAFKVFTELDSEDVAVWNSLIEGYGGSNQGERGLQILGAFMEFRLEPDEITMTAILGICTNLVMLDYGKQVHSLSVKNGLNSRIQVENSMIDMYSKCGSLEDGLKVFRFMKKRSLISWTAMMGGLAHHGRTNEVIQLFEEMKREGLKPNKVTYTCVLSACNHGGLLDLGQGVYDSMEMEPETEHLICMVHILAGARRFEEAEEFIEKSGSKFRELLWQAFLVTCKNSGECERGVKVAEKIMEKGLRAEPLTLVLLSNVFAAAGRWEEVGKLREDMRERGMKKEPGCSWIEVDNVVQVYGMEKSII
ncbi:hypothetical protein HHK36_031026 [Tetracentron sinense]|uniref:Pentatricopeptide repeat-containing protein n=1 Tax=Tetracentron sinense TaxID=13715 RepID=A0A834YAA8_TETSI|nr:hypothetical protein HHK36_031026 [Tetracentron sinense]